MKNSISLFRRRDFLRLGAGAALATLASPVFAARNERRLSLVNLHTDERLDTAYWVNGVYQRRELVAVNYLLRDHRTGTVGTMAPLLLDQLFVLQQLLHLAEPYEVVSGYRSPQTNAMLSRTTSGVARHSLHMEGRAIDVRLGSGGLHELLNLAHQIRAGGVGYYPQSGFVHLDTGPYRTWRGA